ncbi:MAG: NAD(P)/FAD-dependent oxidoreductase [Acidobacteria bacterium]|nr:NAD(P)/FAD-dependent oxidoreductase [Acidobacteriota bacterium]
MKTFDVVIIGAGLAGLQCAKLLSRRGAKILLVDRKTDLAKGIHTTGIFVRKTFEDFDFPPATLGKAVRCVTLYSPKLKNLKLESDKDEFRVGKMGKLYESFLQECLENGVEFASGTRYVSAEMKEAVASVKLEKNGESFEIKTKVLVGADGALSRVAKDLRLEENKEWIVGFEEIFKNVPLDNEPQLHCFLDARLAPGYLAWITNDGEETHIGVGGYAEKFNPREALREFRQRIAPKFVDLKNAKITETRGGRIPVGGVLRSIASENGLLIGDAAGAVSPLTAGGLDPCLRLSAMAASVITERLQTDNPKILLNYSGELFRARFVSRLWMRRIIAMVSSQKLLELGFAFLRGKIGRKFASHVFFGRGSFPDVEIKINAKSDSLNTSLLKTEIKI